MRIFETGSSHVNGAMYCQVQVANEERKPAMNRDEGVEKSGTWNGLFT